MSTPEQVIAANKALHAHLAARYKTVEPHYRSENRSKVETILLDLFQQTGAERLLDLGCGTGFMIDLARPHLKRIDGVDITPAMLAEIQPSDTGAEVILHQSDSGSFAGLREPCEIVTAYSFLHHLFDPWPTLQTAYRALTPGGVFYIDLEPNFYFWEALSRLDRSIDYNPIIQRELRQIEYQDDFMRDAYGVSFDIFRHAEYGKLVRGGFKADELVDQLHAAGFRHIDSHYHWFIGEGKMINDSNAVIDRRFANAALVDDVLRNALPLTRHLFKYLRIFAWK